MMTVVKHIGLAIFAAGFTFAMWVVYAIASDVVHKQTRPATSISDMLAEARYDRIEEITVRGTRYEYRIRRGDKSVQKVAYGPKTTATELAPFAGKAKIDVK